MKIRELRKENMLLLHNKIIEDISIISLRELMISEWISKLKKQGDFFFFAEYGITIQFNYRDVYSKKLSDHERRQFEFFMCFNRQ